MKRIVFCLIACITIFVACEGNNKRINIDTLPYKEVILRNNFADTCIVFKDAKGDTIRFNRNFEILENTFGDTMNVGINYVNPGETGKYFTIQVDTLNSTIFRENEYRQYLEEKDLPELYTAWLCFYNLSIRHSHRTSGVGQMRIRVYYKPNKVVSSGKN